MSRSYLSLRWVVQSCTRWSNIATNSEVWVFGIDCKHPTIEALWVVRKFPIVLLRSPYIRFLSGPPDDLTSDHKFESISGLVEGLFLYLSFIENQYTTKCWAQLSTNCYTSFWRSSLCTCVSIKSSTGLGSRPRTITCSKKILSVK
jgi:hypothetical protein